MESKPSSLTLLMRAESLEELYVFYDELGEIQPSPNEYIGTFIKGEGYTISVYSKSHNGAFKVVLQGEKCQEEAAIWLSRGASLEKEGKAPSTPKQKENEYTSCQFPQIGSDEVGTGDYFGPIIVVAAYAEKKDLPRLKELGVTDSKKMEDSHILEIGPSLIKEFKYSMLCLDNPKYNSLRSDDMNMNEMKAKMHNAALRNLKKLYPSAHVYVDQFVEESLYYYYLYGEKEIVRDITFKTKGESYFPAVALASVIARYTFLRYMEKLSEELGETIPFGAGKEVDAFALKIYEKYGLEKLDSLTKANFANRKKIVGEN